MTTSTELGVNQVAARIHLRLQRYIEAQYHIRHTDVIEERRLLLEEPAGISQRPHIEVTPSYAVAGAFGGLRIPRLVCGLLDELAGWRPSVGVYPPYRHQADALEQFFGGRDLVVATGTGSGKTETFLYSILGMLALEGAERHGSFTMPGVRALLLYPMNALVSDQTARLRRLLGHEAVAQLFRERWGRQLHFGMYTSRTPYPGIRSAAKDGRHLDSLLGYYANLESSDKAEDQVLVRELRERGRWPAKDIAGFYGRDLVGERQIKSGKKVGQTQKRYNWDKRLVTQPNDRELLTRHEMQASAPDLLITNYSMLEYMLLRPIERPIFTLTRTWLEADERNQLLLVLDEAHMYRGVGGAEVGLLIRRLMSRLGIPRSRLRCIMTSASIGGGDSVDEVADAFGVALTGRSGRGTFAPIQGTREERRGSRPGTSGEAAALGDVRSSVLAAWSIALEDARTEINGVAGALGWPSPPAAGSEAIELQQYVTRCLNGFGPLEALIERCAGNAMKFDELAALLFPGAEPRDAERATDGLLALGCFARRSEPGREGQPLLPTRVHLMFRGLPPLYACINSSCGARRRAPGTLSLLGRLFTAPRTHCECGARVYELLTHRDCGTAFLRVFSTEPRGQFLWHQKGGVVGELGRPLQEIHLLIEEPHTSMRREVEPLLLDPLTGRVLATTSTVDGLRLCYRTIAAPDAAGLSTFPKCPVCTTSARTGGGDPKIMDLATKGEQPFANLIREQFVCQPSVREIGANHPNAGRKTLLFSDGRQKAARLARDLPREVERDSFREALILAASELERAERPVVLDHRLYVSFVATCARHHLHFFDGDDQRKLIEDCERFRIDYDGDLSVAEGMEWQPEPLIRYKRGLLRQIADPYYSLVSACAATVVPAGQQLLLVRKRTSNAFSEEVIAAAADIWLAEMLRRWAFDPSLPQDARLDEHPYFRAVKADDDLRRFSNVLRTRATLDAAQVTTLRDALLHVFTTQGESGEDSGRLIVARSLQLVVALERTWLQCAACGNVQPKAIFGGCARCDGLVLEERPPEHEYMRARKGFFRDPLREVLAGKRPVHITAEEHTAQLSQRDAGVVYATTEEFELRFQDVRLPDPERPGSYKPPVDILSCTTTMEVGIDIGSLTAVGLRTVPPQRENYQQRAGRSGRRGTSMSTVLTFAQGGAHDAHYFANPAAIISGSPRAPRIKSDNRRLARRHVNSHLLQTFFHGQIDKLSPREQATLASTRPGIMSAFGEASTFFAENGPFSFSAFELWMTRTVLAARSAAIADIAGWLPDELAGSGDTAAWKLTFVRGLARELLEQIRGLGGRARVAAADDDAVEPAEDDDDRGSFLDMLFDKGLLPSYAFPTDLCSFVIQKLGNGGRIQIKERPQLAKAQALSEYAPGRLLVVNKETFRVGGIFVAEGPTTSSPARALFASPLRRYVGCSQCTYVRLEPGNAITHTPEGTACPVCATSLSARDLLDPPGFSPENGKAAREGDRDQDITFATSAQLPELLNREDFKWREGPGRYIQHAYGENVVLVVTNKGKAGAGFAVCEDCGAAWVAGEEPDATSHQRPFLLPNFVRAREQTTWKCGGGIRAGIFLGHEFQSDALLVRVPLARPMDFRPRLPWLHDALATFAEALALGASLHLDIDPGEVSAGYRVITIDGTNQEIGEVYLFDTASGGAGYSADAGDDLNAVLRRTLELLEGCTCERSCTRCLRHYGNRFLHYRLDRRLAADVLRYGRSGETPRIASPSAQADRLGALERYLHLEGWQVSRERSLNGQTVPLLASHPARGDVAIGTHPALLDVDAARDEHDLPRLTVIPVVLLPDYVVERDLPTAYTSVVEALDGTRAKGDGSRTRRTGIPREMPSIDLAQLLSGVRRSSGTVRLIVDTMEEDCFAVRITSDWLTSVDVPAGAWLVLREVRVGDVESDRRMVLQRNAGPFRATGQSLTVSRLRRLAESTADDVMLLYGKAAEQFRPERIERSELVLVGELLEVVEDGAE